MNMYDDFQINEPDNNDYDEEFDDFDDDFDDDDLGWPEDRPDRSKVLQLFF